MPLTDPFDDYYPTETEALGAAERHEQYFAWHNVIVARANGPPVLY